MIKKASRIARPKKPQEPAGNQVSSVPHLSQRANSERVATVFGYGGPVGRRKKDLLFSDIRSIDLEIAFDGRTRHSGSRAATSNGLPIEPKSGPWRARLRTGAHAHETTARLRLAETFRAKRLNSPTMGREVDVLLSFHDRPIGLKPENCGTTRPGVYACRPMGANSP